MSRLLVFLVVALLTACGQSEPPLAGNMTAHSICSTSGYIIRQNLGNNFKTVNVSCRVQKLDGNNVKISSGYKSPLGATLRYTAHGVVTGNTLRFKEIKVHGVDDDFIPFEDFRG